MRIESLFCVVLAMAYGRVTVPEKAVPSAAAQPPLKVAVYADAGPSGIGAVEWFRLIEESPELELHLVDGAAIRAGALDGLDLLVMPGGDSKTEFTTLGTNGIREPAVGACHPQLDQQGKMS